MADHWAHWLSVGSKLRATGTVPRIFQVNWFRKGSDGSFVWPGFGENARVLEWILERVDAKAAAVDSPLGLIPTPGGINVDGLDLDDETMASLFEIDAAAWLEETDSTEEFFDSFGERVPKGIRDQLAQLRERLA
jgi:phosphoenolpyruvate carboxykinase (GTP)